MRALFICVAMVFSWANGYGLAHIEVRSECQKLGKFYVDETVFDCAERIAGEK